MKKSLVSVLALACCLWSGYTLCGESIPSKEQPWIVPDVGMKFVYVTPGSFQMGSNEYAWEKPAHRVTISKEYWVGKYEVTQEEFEKIMGCNPSYFKGNNKPVDSVTWVDAVNFCKKLTERERAAGRVPSGYEYRLLTEAEWDFAARGGVQSKGCQYSGSIEHDKVAWHSDNAENATKEVGTKPANELGIHDMCGNVWEFCLDDWRDTYDNAPMDGRRVGDGTAPFRVSRGGSWLSNDSDIRLSARTINLPNTKLINSTGFRVAIASVIN